MPYKDSINEKVAKLNDNYTKMKGVIDKLHHNLNGTNFDKTCQNVQRLFEKAEREFMNDSTVSIREQLDFYYELRKACIELGELKAYLEGYINNKIYELEKVKETTVENVQEQTEQVIEFPKAQQQNVHTLKKVA